MFACSRSWMVASWRILRVAALCFASGVTSWAHEPAADHAKLVENGAKLFAHSWRPNDPAARGGDGLGPVYNESSCAACHSQGGMGGSAPARKNVQLLTGFGLDANDAPSRRAIARRRIRVSQVLHRFGTAKGYDAWRDEQFQLAICTDVLPSVLEENANDAKKARRSITASQGDRALTISERNAAALFGDGLIDQIPDRVIQAQVQSTEFMGPLNMIPKQSKFDSPIKGRVVLLDCGRVGKFGWKAQQATLAEFTLSACAVEIGLEVPLHHQLPDPQNEHAKSHGFDMNKDDCNALIAFVSALPAPRRETPAGFTREAVMIGEALFNRVGCTGCHKPRLGDVDGLYSDLLVHNMGSRLADIVTHYGLLDARELEGTPANPSEWRTPPLWGVADSAPYLHDGRAQTLREAILLHDGEASDSADRFSGLSDVEQAGVITFLRSLQAPRPMPMPEAITGTNVGDTGS